MRQPTTTMEEFHRVFLSLCSRSSHLESGSLFPLSLFWQSLFQGVAFEYEYWILRETTFFVGAMLGTTVDTCSASVLR